MNYNVTLIKPHELVLDVDDLIGILQQLDALVLGYDAMPFSCVEIDDETGLIWERI